ncbi:hypothetical protein ACIBUY_06270 [Streptomyces sp. NPDC050085]|uniref:hypothetical protein n=1 Tax=Streptomyces sp. NPDC050085 TaxID=3365600 RepID=UPI0037AF570F
MAGRRVDVRGNYDRAAADGLVADNAKGDARYALAKQLLADGVPLNGINIQA